MNSILEAHNETQTKAQNETTSNNYSRSHSAEKEQVQIRDTCNKFIIS